MAAPASPYAFHLPPHRVTYGITVKVADLRVDPAAQRSLNESRAKYIADNLIEAALGSIICSQRKVGKFVVDGRHRFHACELAGVEEIVAEVHHDLTREQEAILFLLKNQESKGVGLIDQYKVGLTGGVPRYVDTDKILKAHSLTIGSSSSTGIGAIASVLRITDDYGPNVLDRTLTVAEDAFGRTKVTWDGMILGGLGKFIGDHAAVVTDKELATKLRAIGPAEVMKQQVLYEATRGNTQHSGTQGRINGGYEVVRTAWNKNRRRGARALII